MNLLTAQVSAPLLTAPTLAAAGAAAVAIPVAIHLLSRVRRQREPWAAMRFLLAAYRKHKRRLKLEQFILLLVRCTLVLLLGLALAGPLTQGVLSWFGSNLGESGRVLHIIVDDGATAGVRVGDHEARLDALRTEVSSLLEALPTNDRVVLWSATDPSQPLAGVTRDRAETRAALEAMTSQPRRADLSDALVAAAESVQDADGRAEAWVFSGLSRGTVGPGQALPDAAGLDRLSAVWLRRASPEAVNVQVASVEPRRALVTLQSERGRLTADVELKRFGGGLGVVETPVTLELIEPGTGRVVASSDRRHVWRARQTETSVALELTWDAPDAPARQSLALRATVGGASLNDQLPIDNEALSLVEVRRQLTVGVVDDTEAADLPASVWVELALSPDETGEVIRVQRVRPSAVDTTLLNEVDGLMVLRPDRVSAERWSSIASWVQQGGLLWVTAPGSEDATAAWSERLAGALDLPWRISDTVEQAEDETGWALDTDADTPEALVGLRADWARLLRPVRVTRRLTVDGAPLSDVWASVATTEDTEPWVLARAAGQGRVVLMLSAMDPAWTDLVTRPLFVAWMQDAWPGLLAQTLDTGEFVGARVDDEPFEPALGTPEDSARAGLGEVLPEAGLWQGVDTGRWRAVRVDPSAGDTRAWDESAINRWLGPLGVDGWSWFDDPAVARAQAEQPVGRQTLTEAMLWVVLALVLLEMLLARRFSHAMATDRKSLRSQLASIGRGLAGRSGRAAS